MTGSRQRLDLSTPAEDRSCLRRASRHLSPVGSRWPSTAPAQVPGIDDPAQAMTSCADIAQQLAAVDIEVPDSMNAEGFDQWSIATRSPALPNDGSSGLSAWRAVLDVASGTTPSMLERELREMVGGSDTGHTVAAS